MGLSCIALCACSKQSADDDRSKESVQLKADNIIPEVETITLEETALNHDIVSNGHVKARESADLTFRTPDIVSEIFVKNGQHVRKGQPLARLDLFKLESEKKKQLATLDQAELQMKDVLISQGYDPENLSKIPQDVVKLARVKSGMEQAEASYNSVLKDIEQATLIAPFDGVVANMKLQKHSVAPSSESAMRLINDGLMNIEFPILESELAMINVGELIEVTPFAGGETQKGQITEINPMIDENGHVNVIASITGAKGLIDGMNARVRITRNLGQRLVVPKSAVVLRTGRQVVFTYQDGKAMWNYVTTGFENLDSYEITEGLEAGQTVIIGGNENLAHEAPVKPAAGKSKTADKE